jgi:DNA primase
MDAYLSPKDEIKRLADIVGLVGQFVQLRKAGRNFVGLCPFHAEKDPSFTINPERQTFHCFGCKKGGDVFDFWMEYHSATFKEALRDLAEKYNVPITDGYASDSEKKNYSRKKTLYRINEKAADYFEKILLSSSFGEPARQYIARRSLDKKTISRFKLGYAPDEWNGLARELIRAGFDMALAVDAGVVIAKEKGGYYDRFRGRVIFPIFDLRNQIVGFGGRVLDDSLPKYVNTPETTLFRKGELLYGLHAARDSIRNNGRVIVVEGYMDLLALSKNQIDFAVATLGTALTPFHARKLRGYANEVVVMFDSDEAGKKAALKSMSLFANEGLSAMVVVLPDGHDPDSFLNEVGRDRFLALLDDAVPMLDFYFEMEVTDRCSDSAVVRVLKDFFPVLAGLGSEATRSIYIRRLAEKTGVGEATVLSEFGQFMRKSSGVSVDKGLEKRLAASKAGKRITDLQVLNLLICHPQSISRLMAVDCRVLLSDPTIIEIVDAIFERCLHDGNCSTDNLMESIKNESAREQLREISHRAFIVYSESDVEQAIAEVESKVRRVKFLESLKKAKGNAEAQHRLIRSELQGH